MSKNKQLPTYFSLEETLFVIKLLRNELDIDIIEKSNQFITKETFIRLVLHHGLISHLYNSHYNKDLQQLLRKTLKNQYFAVTIRNSQLFETFRVITQQFSENNIDFVPLKGSFILPIYYKDHAGRAMSDIDILIDPTDYVKCKDLLIKLGAIQDIEVESDFLQELGHHFPPFSIFNSTIEIHNRILPANVRYNIPVEDVWQNLESYNIDGVQMKGINTYLLICYLSLHIYYSEKRGEYRIYWYMDIYKVLQNTPDFTLLELNKWLDKYHINGPVLDIICKTCYLFNINIDGLNPISESTKEIFLQNLANPNSIARKGYSIALERVWHTKGISNKIRYITHTIKFGEAKTPNSNILQRTAKIAGRFISYFSQSTISFLKRFTGVTKSK